ncbi:hypothetical protein KXX13_000375 [Aspergillus fumigatus]|nr:hypothetical protein KXX13_000375 [Aspergillus fumigatus]KAH2224315.1 hypothetical protein KXV37_008040 [Aspergillus fumigatus]KAH2588146.1 hypothetical protein KXV63_002122 [Aspergillus fumigatus]KAH2674817.1 hypothetical protein KXV51_004389 [Aspergillus fumigatus]KAH3180857.1 hypothetical protein KXX02_004361 [Aspergillus fumigatus]
MEQIREPVLQGRFQSLDEAAKETTTALARANIRHGFIGGYADIDIIVDADPSDARSLLLQAHSGFRLSQNNKLIFTGAEEDVRSRQLKLPDANVVSIVPLTANDQPERIRNTPIPIVAPSVLVLTKIKRWSTLAESTRPQSIKKADSDIDDIEVLLKWLARNQFHIDFEGYLAKPKEELLSGVRKLYQMHAAFRPLLETTLDEESFALINN